MRTICLFGSASQAIDERYLQLATDVGREIGRRGYGLIFGGGGTSVMGAAEAAARAAGAHTVGVIPEALVAVEAPPEGLGELVVTKTMRERKQIMDERADAFIVLPGGIGTLEEIFEIWVARTIGMHTKPMVVVDCDGHYAGLVEWLHGLVARGFARDIIWQAAAFIDNPVKALDWLESAPRERLVAPASETVGKFTTWPTDRP